MERSLLNGEYVGVTLEGVQGDVCWLWDCIDWKGGFEKVVELVGVCVEGDGSESANSSGFSISELLYCEIVV